MSSSLLGNLNLPQELEDKLLSLLNAPTTAVAYCNAYVWTPTLASEDASGLTNGASCAAFIGENASTTVGVVHGTLQGTLMPDAAGDVSFTATLPASADEVVYVSGYANSSSAILLGGLIVGSAMSLSFVSPDTDPYVFFVNFTYRTGAA